MVAVVAGIAAIAVPAAAQVVKPVEYPANPNQPKANNPAEKALYDAASALGMIRFKAADRKLRTDVIDVIEFTGAGTWNDQKVTAVTVGLDYVYPAVRADVDKGNGAHEIAVAREKVSWDESKPGVFQKASTVAAAERLRDMWLLPTGIVLAGTQAMDKLKVADKPAGQRELTVSTPGGFDVKATMDAKGFIIHTEATVGGKLYSGDFSNFIPDGMDFEVMFPGRLTLKVDGKAYTDLTIGKVPDAKLSAGVGPATLVPGGNAFFPDPYIPFPIPKEVAAK